MSVKTHTHLVLPLKINHPDIGSFKSVITVFLLKFRTIFSLFFCSLQGSKRESP